MTARLRIVRPGALSTVQDYGRPGYADLAVPRSGALDRPALRLANRLVGNPEDAAVLETTVDGVAFSLTERRHIAVTGAPAPVTVGGRPVGHGVPVLVDDVDDVVEVGTVHAGLRCYVAISGGIEVEPVMGSRSTDILSGLGPAIPANGDFLPLGPVSGEPARIDFAPYAWPSKDLHLTCYLGPREDWLAAESIDVLGSARWSVSAHSNRIGLRLEGPHLTRRPNGELPSEGVVLGSVQVPANGQPVLFLADHPVTGGYPVVGVVPAPDIWLCAQAAPGTTIRLHTRRLQ